MSWTMRNKLLLMILSVMMTSSSYAMFCPTNLNQIDIGSTIAQVATACGQPTSKKTYKPEDKVPQEWNYYISPGETNPYTSNLSPSVSSEQQSQGSLKTSFVFDENDNLVNITVGNASVTSTNICNGNIIQIPATKKDVEAACGKAPFVNKGQAQQDIQPDEDHKQTEITEWMYAGPPRVILVFHDGVLAERK